VRNNSIMSFGYLELRVPRGKPRPQDTAAQTGTPKSATAARTCEDHVPALLIPPIGARDAETSTVSSFDGIPRD
jgi:hypothetical protein